MTNCIRHRPGARTAPLLVLLAVVGCDLDSMLNVPDPEVASPTSLQGEPGLPLLLAGAKADLQLAFSGGTIEGLVAMGGLFTDELYYTSTFPTRIEVDRREIRDVNSTMEPIHRQLHRARALAKASAEQHEELQPNSTGHAESLSVYGYTLVLFAEHYCSGVPLSTLTPTGAVEYGEPQSTTELLEAAVASFDAALAAATQAGDVDQQNLARVGKARTLVDLGRFDDAAAAVATVPTGFVYQVFHSENSARQQNGNYTFQWVGRRWSVGEREGTTGLAFRSAHDPRSPWQEGNGANLLGFDNSPLYVSLKSPTYSSATVLASGLEARLIEAEAALRKGGNWLAILNSLRAAPPAYYPAAAFPGIGSLQPLTDPGSVAARTDLLFAERAFWLYLTGHRLGDLRRLVRQYNRTAETVFPTGRWGTWSSDKSGDYGTDVNFPIPFDELNNPLFEGCLDRNA